MKKIAFITLAAIVCMVSASMAQQESKNEEQQERQSLFDKLANQYGEIVQFRDYKLPNLRAGIGSYPVCVRVLKLSDGTVAKFLTLERNTDYRKYNGYIPEEEIKEVYEAFKALEAEAEQMKTEKPDYFQSKYISKDGMQLGYTIEGTLVSWFVKLEEYLSASTIWPRDASTIDKLFQDAFAKLSELE